MKRSTTPSRAVSRRRALQTGLTAAAVAFAAPSLWAGPRAPRPLFSLAHPDDVPVPFLNMPRTGPNSLDWESLDAWFTPTDQAFNVQHYGIPEVNLANYRLEVTGMVRRPRSFTLEELRALPRREEIMTLECSGNGSSKGFMNAVYNSRWAGASLRAVLRECGIAKGAEEVLFLGADRKDETLRKDTPRELTVNVPFGRSLALADATRLPLLLAYERNGQPLEQRHGAPLRLIVPGWYGVANVKWLTRIEVRDRRYMGRYMARDYVTVRGERHGNEVVYLESSVGRIQLKSVIARIARGPTRGQRIPLKAFGAAWGDGTPITRVEVRVDQGPWQAAVLEPQPVDARCAWRFFSIDLGEVAPGDHVVVSRVVDARNRVQPAAEDDAIALKKTYWEANQQWPREIRVEA